MHAGVVYHQKIHRRLSEMHTLLVISKQLQGLESFDPFTVGQNIFAIHYMLSLG